MKKEKILIFGNGQIGSFYFRYFLKKRLLAKTSRVDIRDIKKIEKAINNFNPTIVINTAAKTNLEECSQNKLETFDVNVLGADNIAKVCDKKNIYFIHFSSGCIFQSKNKNDFKIENDNPNPAAYYAFTKVWSEELIKFEKSDKFKYLILRPRQPISSELNYKNTLLKMLTFAKFIDVSNSITILEDLMDWTYQLIEKRATGIFNVANSGSSSPYKIGLMLKKHILPNLEIKKISKEELNNITPNRRVDTILSIDKLKSLKIKVNSLDERLENIIIGLKNNIEKADKNEIKNQIEKTIKQSKTRTVVNNSWKDLLK